jgi:hypothetical protein
VGEGWGEAKGFISNSHTRTLEIVIACDKREAFAHGSGATKQSTLPSLSDGLLRFARNDGKIRLPYHRHTFAISPHVREFCSSYFAI